MKIENSKVDTNKKREKLDKSEVRARIMAKFGKKIASPEEKIEIKKAKQKAKIEAAKTEKKGPPERKSIDQTKESLKDILSAGSFEFSSKERDVLKDILK